MGASLPHVELSGQDGTAYCAVPGCATLRAMPTPVAHTLAGIGLYLGATDHRREDVALLGATVVAACFADLDFGLTFLTGQNYHHYFTHSLGFTIVFSVVALILLRRTHRGHPLRDAAILGVAYLSHLALDLLSTDTSPPFGLELLWPFSGTFVTSPVWVFDDIWRGTLAKLFGLHNWIAVAREVAIVGPFVAAIYWWRRRRPAYSE